MKKTYLLFLLLILILSSCTIKNNVNDQSSNTGDNDNIIDEEKIMKEDTLYFKETIESFDSPDCGFYDPVYISCDYNGVSDISNNYLKYNNLLHLRIDISKYSSKVNNNEDMEFTKAMLDDLSNQFEKIRLASASAIVRFAYDPNYDGNKNMEPAVDMMLRHICQLQDLFYEYDNIITAIECGMVGPWGEMHSSDIANQETYNKLINAYLNFTPNNIPILLRRPQFLYSYYGYNIDTLNSFKLDSNNRLGVYNDGYLGSSTDLGTYKDRDVEVNWLSMVNKYLPYGGEVTIPTSEFNLLENCNEEMELLGLSYLNEYWNDQVVNRWKNTKYNLDNELYKDATQFTYIRNRMGYRLVLRDVKYDITSKNNFNIYFNIDNVGFGNLLNDKTYTLILKNENEIIEFNSNNKTYDNLSFTIDISNLNDSYDVYLKISDGYVNNIPFHSIRLANNIWNEQLYANKILENLELYKG